MSVCLLSTSPGCHTSIFYDCFCFFLDVLFCFPFKVDFVPHDFLIGFSNELVVGESSGWPEKITLFTRTWFITNIHNDNSYCT